MGLSSFPTGFIAQPTAAALRARVEAATLAGVELAGTIAELARATLPADFRHTDTRKARIVLIEAGPRVLAGFAENLSDYARRSLERLGVEVVLGEPVTECTAAGVVYGGKTLAAATIIWAAGVRASPAAQWLGAPAANPPCRHRKSLSLCFGLSISWSGKREFCRQRLAGDFRRRMRENGRISVRRPRIASLTDRKCEGFCRPGNRGGLPGLHGGGRSLPKPVSGGASPGAPAKIPWNA